MGKIWLCVVLVCAAGRLGFCADTVGTTDSKTAEAYYPQTWQKATVSAAASAPTIPASGSTDMQGNITVKLSSAYNRAAVKTVWAKVTIDGKVQYWDLSKNALSSDGKSITLKFDPKYDGKKVAMRFYVEYNSGTKSALTNTITIKVNSRLSYIKMPVVPATASTNQLGAIKVNFSSGTINKASLQSFWAKVVVDGKTAYWDLGKAAISADGKSVSLKFSSAYDGKTVQMQFFGVDINGRKTAFSNAIKVTVHSAASTVAMPVLPASAVTSPYGLVAIKFTSGSLDASKLKEFWAKVTIDGKVEYWNITPDAITEDGKGVELMMPDSLKGKTVAMQFYGFDTLGKQTNLTNSVSIKVQ